MFHNVVIPIDNTLQVVRYDHKILDSLKTISPGYPFLITFTIEIVIIIVFSIFKP